MNFSRIARQLNEGESLDAAAKSSENAATGGQKQHDNTARAREKQKAQMAQQRSTVTKSDVSYASEEARLEREMESNLSKQSSDWRKELIEAAGVDDEGNHPYVDVMPFMDQKQNEAKRQMKGAAKMKAADQAGGMQEGASNPFQVHFDKDGKSYTSRGTKAQRDKIRDNLKSNAKTKPDPYRARPGESD